MTDRPRDRENELGRHKVDLRVEDFILGTSDRRSAPAGKWKVASSLSQRKVL